MASNINTELTTNLSELNSSIFDEDLTIETPLTSSAVASENAPPTTSQLWQRKQATKARQRSMVWIHSRARLPHEDKMDKHRHLLFYCRHYSWRGTQSNAKPHLINEHQITSSEEQTPRKAIEQRTIGASFSIAEKLSQKQADSLHQNHLAKRSKSG